MARIARIRHDADGLFKSRCNLFQAAKLNPFCGVEDMVSKLFPSNQMINNENRVNYTCGDDDDSTMCSLLFEKLATKAEEKNNNRLAYPNSQTVSHTQKTVNSFF